MSLGANILITLAVSSPLWIYFIYLLTRRNKIGELDDASRDLSEAKK